MKLSTVIPFLTLASLAVALEVPVKQKEAEQSPNPAGRMPHWFLTNCTGGWLQWCRERNTRCSSSWPTSDDQWCELNCECDWWDSCDLYCKAAIATGQIADDGEAGEKEATAGQA
ncbi:hypothetical protein HJFPF1_03974 [Paramyrothecium foliicola]|nr:hypothetical protein HJFPF1_03974 [Paramyrothecium foliicola]